MSFFLGGGIPLLALLATTGIGLSVAVILAGIVLGRGPARRRLGLVAAFLGIVLVILVGGGLLLERYALYWRRWVESVLRLSAGVLLIVAIVLTVRIFFRQKCGPKWLDCVATLVAMVAVTSILCHGGIALVFGSWTDRVCRWPEGPDGQKVVAQSVGIFHEKIYRYVNPFVHGELLYEWKD